MRSRQFLFDRAPQSPDGKQYHLMTVSGFRGKGIDRLAEALRLKVSIVFYTKIDGCPWYKALNSPSGLVEDIVRRMQEMSEPRLIVGDSYGALLVLRAFCELTPDQRNNSTLVLLDGPLNPDVDVRPPDGEWSYYRFLRQYYGRVEMARECIEKLQNGAGGVWGTSIGSNVDSIVPPEAKSLYPLIPHHELDLAGHGLSREKVKRVVPIVCDLLDPAGEIEYPVSRERNA